VNKLSEEKITVSALVEGGKATGGPPIGPALGPTGVNIFQVVTAINEQTQAYAGLKVPVEIIVDQGTKTFEIVVGVPPASALILKEIGADKGSGEPNTNIIGNITVEQLKTVAHAKAKDLSAQSMKAAAMIISGTCVSVGVTVEGKSPKEFQQEVRDGTWDEQLAGPLREA